MDKADFPPENRHLSPVWPLRDQDMPKNPGPSTPSCPPPPGSIERRQEWGRAIEYGRLTYRTLGSSVLRAHVVVSEEDVLVFLQIDAAAHLPPGTRYEVRAKLPGIGQPVDQKTMVWYRTKSMDDEPEWLCGLQHIFPDRGYIFPESGYRLIGRFVTPAHEA